MHQALYRKWRPRDFDDVCGQDHITSILKNEIETGRINHAYLFCGTRGTGKTTCAKIFAKAVNCTDYKDGHVCGKCAACTSADDGSAPDIIEMDAASNNGVANIRDIRDEVNYLPSELKYRVYIVDEVHMLSTSAFNALLKTLEEPPSHVIFILATTEIQKLPSTIISRCQRFDFRRIPSATIADRLEHIAKEEGFSLEREAAFSIASIAQGGMRDAISLLELCANGAPDSCVNEKVVAELIGTGERDVCDRAIKAIADRDFDTVFDITSKIYMSSRDMSVFWQALTSAYRDMLVIKSSPAAKEYLDLSDNRFEVLSGLAGRFSFESLVYHTRLLDDAYTAMQRGNTNKRLVAECALVRMCDEKLSPSFDALNARVAALERALAGGATITSAPEVQAKATTPSVPKPQEIKFEPVKCDEPITEPIKQAPTEVKAEIKPEPKPEQTEPKQAPKPAGEVRRLKPIGYYSEVLMQFSELYPLEGAFLEDASAYIDEDGCVRVRLATEIAEMMIKEESVFSGLLDIFNSFENGRLDKNTLLIETVEAVKNSYIDEIIESAED